MHASPDFNIARHTEPTQLASGYSLFKPLPWEIYCQTKAAICGERRAQLLQLVCRPTIEMSAPGYFCHWYTSEEFMTAVRLACGQTLKFAREKAAIRDLRPLTSGLGCTTVMRDL